MRWTLKRRKPRGTILGMSLLLLSLLTSLGAGLLGVALNAHTGARHDINAQRALAVAEAGIAHARRLIATELPYKDKDLSGRLTGATAKSPEVFLAGFEKGVANLGPGSGTYSVWVGNNLDPYKGIPGEPLDPTNPDRPAHTDTDNRIWIRSAGIYRNVTRTVRVLVDLTDAMDILNALNPPGAITLIDGDLADMVGLQGSFSVNGNDYNLGLTTAGACRVPPGPRYGISVNSAASLRALDNTVGKNEAKNITGTGASPSYANNGTISRPLLEKVATALLPQATPLPGGTNQNDYGSPTAPGTFVANSNITLTGNGKGYGILIVTGGVLDMAGTYRWEGLIIVLGNGSVTVTTGTPNVYGALLAANTQKGATQLTIKGNPGFNFSSQALCRIQAQNQNLLPTPKVIAWQQVG